MSKEKELLSKILTEYKDKGSVSEDTLTKVLSDAQDLLFLLSDEELLKQGLNRTDELLKLLLESKERVVFFNTERGVGKTTSLVKYILTTKPKNVVWNTYTSNMNQYIYDKFNQETDARLSFGSQGIEGVYCRVILIQYKDGQTTKIYFTKELNQDIDLYICDDAVFLNKITIDKDIPKTIIMTTDTRVKLVDYIHNEENIINDNFYDNYIEVLKKELLSIPNTSNTVMTRQNLINMIEKLTKLRNE